jgi:hypothetical protein
VLSDVERRGVSFAVGETAVMIMQGTCDLGVNVTVRGIMADRGKLRFRFPVPPLAVLLLVLFECRPQLHRYLLSPLAY